MELRQRIRRFWNRIKGNRGSSRPRSLICKCNWPELTKYCGCCNIATGIYITSSITVFLTSAAFVFNLYLLITTFKRKTCMGVNSNTTDDCEQDYLLLYRGATIYYIFWNALNILEVIRNIFTLYAVYKKSAIILKIILYVGVPCWVFDIFLSSIASIVFKFYIKLLLGISFLIDGYNLLAISSKYKDLTGKSRIVPEEDFEPRLEPTDMNEIVNPPHRSLRFPPSNNQPHCPTCTCFLDQGSFEEGTENHSEFDSPTSTLGLRELINENFNEDRLKTLNFKDEVIVFNQEYLEERSSPLFENVASPSVSAPAQRPKTLALNLEKKDIADIPVIYDENQLNVGKSPVVEDL